MIIVIVIGCLMAGAAMGIFTLCLFQGGKGCGYPPPPSDKPKAEW